MVWCESGGRPCGGSVCNVCAMLYGDKKVLYFAARIVLVVAGRGFRVTNCPSE